jgi:hypothetical protein
MFYFYWHNTRWRWVVNCMHQPHYYATQHSSLDNIITENKTMQWMSRKEVYLYLYYHKSSYWNTVPHSIKLSKSGELSVNVDKLWRFEVEEQQAWLNVMVIQSGKINRSDLSMMKMFARPIERLVSITEIKEVVPARQEFEIHFFIHIHTTSHSCIYII